MAEETIPSANPYESPTTPGAPPERPARAGGIGLFVLALLATLAALGTLMTLRGPVIEVWDDFDVLLPGISIQLVVSDTPVRLLQVLLVVLLVKEFFLPAFAKRLFNLLTLLLLILATPIFAFAFVLPFMKTLESMR